MSEPEVKLLPSSVKPSNPLVACAIMIFLIDICLSSQAIAQISQMNAGNDSILKHEMPVFLGGMDRLYNLITENLEYPKAARREGVSGRVVVGFIVDTTGTISEVHILEGVRADIDQEAMRLVSLLKNWKPGRMDGKPVRVRYELPLTFSLDNKRKKKVMSGKAAQ